MYPGVPEVSFEFYSLNYLAIPKSVRCKYPWLSKTRFSGLMSRWMMFLLWINYNPWQMQAAKNLICCSVNLCFLQIWYRRSPPGIRSIIRYRVSLSWKACLILTKNLCFKEVSNFLSLRTESMLFFVMILNSIIKLHSFWHLFHREEYTCFFL